MSECEHIWERPLRNSPHIWKCTFCEIVRDTRQSTVAPDTGAAASGVMGPVVTPERIAFNVNDYVRVKLNDRGRAIHRAIWDDIRASHPKVGEYRPPKEDADGWSRWQLWNLMQDFGPHITLGSVPPFDTTIEFEFAARSAPAVPTGRESASQDVAHRDTREGLERSATELREQAEADAKRIFGGRSTTRDRE